MDREVAAAWAALELWLADVDDALGPSLGLSHLRLTHPEPGRAPIDMGLVDADLAHVLVSAVQMAGEEVDGLYVGLVAQEPSARWIGLAGFYVPICPACDGPGVARATDRVLDLLTGSGFEEVQSSAVPGGARPQPGWFDRGRLQTVCRRPVLGRSEWRPWPPESASALPDVGMLVRVSPVVSSLAGLVLCRSSTEADLLPALLGQDPTAWTWTAGALEQLATACHHRPRPPKAVQRRPDSVYDWWAFRFPGRPSRLGRGGIPRAISATNNPSPTIWVLTDSGPALASELAALLHGPA